MMPLLSILLSALLGQITGNINRMTLDTEKDSSRIEKIMDITDKGENTIVYMLELFFKTPVTKEEVSGILALQKRDGSWEDIDYHDNSLSQCRQTLHAIRFQRLAVYHRLNPADKAVTKALHRALKYWGNTMPQTRSWYYNQVNIPKAFGPGLLLILDEMSSKEKKWASAIMHQAKLTRTGQNLVWEAGNLLIAGLIDDNETLVRDMAMIIQRELRCGVSDAGLRKDWSFLQHGSQLQFGNYGLSFVISQAFWHKALYGTELELSSDKLSILKEYVCKGVGRTVWNGFMDMNALGRQLFPDSQYSKALSIEYAMGWLGLDALNIENGPRYYPEADFCNYRGAGWYASLRMQSARTVGYEELNGENQKGYFSADGALLVRRVGTEYYDVAPFWDWRHIPGATTWDDGKPLWGTHTDTPYNKSDHVFGKVFDDKMIVAMEYIRDGVSARKIWVFMPEGILCMGHGISSSNNGRIITTVEQSLECGPVEKGERWVSHRGVSYVSLGRKEFSFAGTVNRSGSWKVAAPYYSDDMVSGALFEVYYDHGIKPDNDNYAYFIAPGIPGKDALEFANSRIRIISEETADVQGLHFTVDWNENKIIIQDTMTAESPNYIIGNDNPVTQVKPGLKRQILGYNENLMLVKVIFGPEMVGQKPPLHSHHQSQSSYIVSGRFEFHCGDKETVILGPGDSYYIEPDTPHEVWCLEPGVIIDGFNPFREDFLK